ncbi:ECF sigma factor [Rubripirellula lacrimiformis]|uniref:ECF sigma factor n=1 Tax=Rubripirellula lacrimiformis TaxID=1930273 RepID=A0A517NCQ8_9BACT|nr:ECF-type sigma factor [Rubripirellula lacrimiformis]QDT04925.1 ECF sigma factor [Rubripirellula lacrimiformis]
MDDVTQILEQIERGDPTAPDQLMPLVYSELRRLAAAKIARESAGHTLQATALVHEAYVRLVGSVPDRSFSDRRHFFAAAATAMKRILVDRARAQYR